MFDTCSEAFDCQAESGPVTGPAAVTDGSAGIGSEVNLARLIEPQKN